MGATQSTVLHFGSGLLDATGFVRRKTVAAVVKAAAAGAIHALVVDARSADDFFRGQALLRALYDDPRNPRRVLHPGRVLAIIATGDVEAAFTLGRYGIAGVLEERSARRARAAPAADPRIDTRPRAAAPPALAPPRSTHLGARAEDELPTVTIGYRHAPETLAALARYCACCASTRTRARYSRTSPR